MAGALRFMECSPQHPIQTLVLSRGFLDLVEDFFLSCWIFYGIQHEFSVGVGENVCGLLGGLSGIVSHFHIHYMS